MQRAFLQLPQYVLDYGQQMFVAYYATRVPSLSNAVALERLDHISIARLFEVQIVLQVRNEGEIFEHKSRKIIPFAEGFLVPPIDELFVVRQCLLLYFNPAVAVWALIFDNANGPRSIVA